MKLSDLLDPLVLGLVALLVGMVLWHRATPSGTLRRVRGLVWAGWLWLALASSPQVSNRIARAWQPPPADLGPLLDGTTPEQRALVILSAGMRTEEPFVPPVERLDGETQGRLIGGARIFAQYGFGIVVITGTGQGFVDSMAQLLVQLGVPADKIAKETRATDTRENALFSAPILAPLHPKRIVLVTSALHMRRSVKHFRNAGMDVVAAPVDYQGGPTWRLLPSSASLGRTSAVLHEVLGMLEP